LTPSVTPTLFAGKAGAYRESDVPCLRVLVEGEVRDRGINTLAYYDTELIMAVQYIILQAPGVKLIKLLSSLQLH